MKSFAKKMEIFLGQIATVIYNLYLKQKGFQTKLLSRTIVSGNYSIIYRLRNFMVW